ncbi:MAG: zinc transporter [Kiritimatiellia bacterium]|jgi:zinc transporter
MSDSGMESFPGLIFAVNLDGKGGALDIPSAEIRHELELDSLTWVHLDYSVDGIQDWLRRVGGLDEVAIAALTASEPRPRCIPHGEGQIVILRGVNQNPGADREDMISLRIWIEADCIISMRQRRLLSASLIRDALTEGKGPLDQGSLIISLGSHMCDNIAQVVADLDEKADNLEETVMTMASHDLRSQLADIRREAISVRRYLAPQRDALSALMNLRLAWLDDTNRMYLRDVADRTTRYIEDLDAIRERAVVTQEELNSRIAERMNRIMYFFSIITGIFLPLGLLTGLLGINVGGMPGAHNDLAFWMVCGLLGLITLLELWIFKKLNWF